MVLKRDLNFILASLLIALLVVSVSAPAWGQKTEGKNPVTTKKSVKSSSRSQPNKKSKNKKSTTKKKKAAGKKTAKPTTKLPEKQDFVEKASPAPTVKHPPLVRAAEQAKKGDYATAYKILADNFKLVDPETPLPVVSTAATWALQAGDIDMAEKLAYNNVQSRLSWWKTYARSKDTAGEDLSSRLNGTNEYHRQLMWVAGEAKSLRFAQNYDRLSDDEKARLKTETKALYDALVQSDYDSEKVEIFQGRMVEAEELAAKRETKSFKAISVRQLFWHDSFDFTDEGVKNIGQIVAQGLCVGGSVGRASFFRDYALSGCLGRGKASLDFDSGEFSNGHTALLAMISGSYMLKFSESHIGLGALLDVFAREIDISSSNTGGAEKVWNYGFAPQIVTRITTTEGFYLDIKGGRLIGEHSGFWVLEFGWTL